MPGGGPGNLAGVSEPLSFHETVETPEQVQLHLELAGLGTRSIAFVLDGLIRYSVLISMVVVALLILTLGLNNTMDNLMSTTGTKLIVVVLIIAYFATEWGYFAVFEWLWNGQTPGKRAMHIRVLKDGGGPISFLDAALRNLLRPIDSSGPTCAFGIVFIFFNRHNKRIGDIVARTIVVRERPKTVTELLKPTTYPVAVGPDKFSELVQRVSLPANEHEMINRFLQRRGQLDRASRQRLAQQIVGVIVARAKAQANGAEWTWPRPSENERFLEELLVFHQKQSGPPV